LEKALADAGLERRPEETPQAWLRRLATQGDAAGTSAAPLLDLHYRHRFDPVGLNSADRAKLRDGVRDWKAERGRGQRTEDRRPKWVPS
jgi:hypothetical protein